MQKTSIQIDCEARRVGQQDPNLFLLGKVIILQNPNTLNVQNQPENLHKLKTSSVLEWSK